MPRRAEAGRLRLLALGAVALTASGAAACGGGEGSAGDASTAEATTVRAADFSFQPGEVEVEAGTTVTWTNTGRELHNVRGKEFFSEALAGGGSYAHRFTEAGDYRYTCTLHPTQMRGVITVKASR